MAAAAANAKTWLFMISPVRGEVRATHFYTRGGYRAIAKEKPGCGAGPFVSDFINVLPFGSLRPECHRVDGSRKQSVR